MKKWSALALLLVMTVTLLAACGERDPEKTVIVEVNRQQTMQPIAEKLYDFMLNQIVMMYAQYGYDVDPADEEIITQVKTQTLNTIGETMLLEQKYQELGGGFTDEDRAEIAQSAKDEYEATLENYMTNAGVTREEAEVAIVDMGFTVDALEYMLTYQELDARMRALVSVDVTVSDEEVQARYAELLTQAEQTYAGSPSQYVTDVQSGNTIYTRPEGFRYVQNLLLAFPDEVSRAVTDKNNEYYTLLNESFVAQSELSVEGVTDEQKAEIQARIDDAQAKMDQLDADIEQINADALEALRPEAEAVLAEATAADADFDALMAEYNDDTASGDLLTQGYPVAEGVTSYVQSFTDAAMALENIGDVSGLVESDYGFHILKYTGDVPAGTVPLEEVRDALTEMIRSEKGDAIYEEEIAKWIEAATIRTYINRL